MNALDAMPRGGSLEIELRPFHTGPGRDPDLRYWPGNCIFLPRIFEPFVSSKGTGLGLGLAISRRIAEDHGGGLSASNRPEGGACFILRLPAPPECSDRTA